MRRLLTCVWIGAFAEASQSEKSDHALLAGPRFHKAACQSGIVPTSVEDPTARRNAGLHRPSLKRVPPKRSV